MNKFLLLLLLLTPHWYCPPLAAQIKTRIITALILAAVLFAGVFLFSENVSSFVFGLIALWAAYEWAGLMKLDIVGRWLFCGLVAMLCWQTYIAADNLNIVLWALSSFFWIFLAVPWLRWKWKLTHNDFIAYLLGAILIVALWSAVCALNIRGHWWLIGIMAIAWCTDIGAYLVGRKFGRRSLAPEISPAKTWEGVVGGIATAVFYAITFGLVSGLIIRASFLYLFFAILSLLILIAVGVIGDLFESLLKRQAGIKDTGTFFPGHGGLLDRIDSLLAVLPIAALLLQLYDLCLSSL